MENCSGARVGSAAASSLLLPLSSLKIHNVDGMSVVKVSRTGKVVLAIKEQLEWQK
jgi:hypothetical protein